MASEHVTFFRADKRLFKCDERIRTAGEFVELHPETGKQTEKLLELYRPTEKATRSVCLMLFDNEEDARNHCAKMSGGRLYAVSVDLNEILHVGDMELVNKIDRQIAARSDVQSAIDYWKGILTEHPCREILVSEGKVVEILDFNQSERVRRIKQLVGFKGIDNESGNLSDIFEADPKSGA